MTDLGHDPDDAIALSYLIEHNTIPSTIILSPGFPEQVQIAKGILDTYEIDGITLIIAQDKQNSKNYHPGKHKSLMVKNKPLVTSLTHEPISFTENEVLIIGPAKNLGGKLTANTMFFQGGYSPNSTKPLEKFKGVDAVQSFNPCGSKNNFNMLLESDDIKEKYYIGKNVCHGYTKANLQEQWEPENQTMKRFWDNLKEEKAMHDVLAAQCMLDKSSFVWEQARPVWIRNKMTTVYTEERIWSLIGIK